MYQIKIEKLDHFGRGVSRIDGKIIFVPNTLKGDIVNVKVKKEKNKFLEGEVISFIEKVKRCNICPYSKLCGGCHIIDLEYNEQLDYKVNKVKELFRKNFGFEVPIKEIISDSNTNYRNKVKFHVKDKKLGFYKEESHDIVEIDKCVIAKKEINDVIEVLKDILKKHSFLEVTIRSNGGILLDIEGNVPEDVLLSRLTNIDVIWLNNKLIKGEGIIYEEILGKRFKISPKSFFQVNTEVCSKIFEKARDYIKNKNYSKVLDLYCGTGVIGILVSDFVNEVIGIEVVSDAVKDANENKKLNKIKNISFICDKVENRLSEFKNVDLIIVDPPRSGLDKKSINNILKINPKEIIYISCDPNTLLRDLKLLSENYNIDDVLVADMFPNTYHVETIVYLASK
ncbi:MAG: 23S rRNA (uracil(1939)-C(5))-methyltransferase RlmD [Bacilli bacterium]|nr:23S rRNA (uracil(1939)-C(5))-methyltransferase RlmD [Bacilli bacterium]